MRTRPVDLNSPRNRAAINGDRYFDSSSCKNCGTTQKFTENGSCVQCNRVRTRERARRKKEERQNDNRH